MNRDMVPPGRIRILALALLAATVACGTLFQQEEGREFEDDRFFVRVINDNFYDVTVFANIDGHRQRLGRVTGNRTEVFALPPRVTAGSNVAITLSVQAGGTFTTNQVTVWPGEEVRVRVPPDLHQR